MAHHRWSVICWLRSPGTRRLSLRFLIIALLIVLPLPLLGAMVLVTIRHSAAEWRALVGIGVSGLAVTIFCGTAALLAARRVSRSMAMLSAAALALGNGQRLPQFANGIKEIDDVIAALRMAAAVLAERSEQRRRAEAALRDSEQRFRDIAEIGGDWVWESDAEHRFTLLTGNSLDAMTSTGMIPTATLGKTRWQVAGGNPEIDPRWQQHKAELDAHRPFRRFQYSVARPAARVYLSVSGKPVFDETGMFCGYRGTATNVTDTVTALQRAEQAEARLRDAVDSMTEGFVIYDREDRFVMCNESYRRLYPQCAGDMVPGVPFEVILRHYLSTEQRAEEWLAKRMREHRDLAGAVEQKLTDGRWVLTSERRMGDGGTAGLRIDITAFKAIQAELRASREHLALAQRVAATGSFELDLQTRAVEWSDETYRIFGLRRDIGRLDQTAIEEMVIPEDRQRLRDQIAAVVSNGRSDPACEYRIRRPDGQIRTLHREMELMLDTAGRPSRLVGVVRDVTELREAERRRDELERQLMHSQKLEALGTLAGGVAHDLNNTLVPILALSKLALDELPPASPVRGDIETIARASERARDLVKQVLAFSRKQDFVRDRVDLAAVAREALQMLRASLPATIRIDEQIAAVPPLFGDAGELHQAIVNLVTNAAQAIGAEAGTITVGVGTVGADTVGVGTVGVGSLGLASRGPDTLGVETLGVETLGVETLRADTLLGGGARGGGAPTHAAPHHAETAIRLSVADTGCGIDPATLDRIFEPFFTTKMVGEGTGLGLSVVHGIVTRHGGHIAIHSRPGLGSVFTIALPAIAQPTIAQPAIAQPDTPVPSQTDRPFETAAA
jgi:PAS domain S-box-containing protein